MLVAFKRCAIPRVKTQCSPIPANHAASPEHAAGWACAAAMLSRSSPRTAFSVASAATSQLPAILNHNRSPSLARTGPLFLNQPHNVHAFNHLAEDHVFAIQVWRIRRAQKELRSVGVRPCICHGQNSRSCVLVLEVLITKLVSVNRLSTGTVPSREVTSLAYEVWNHAVKRAALVVQRLARASFALLTSAQGPKIFCRFWHRVREQLHFDASGRAPSDFHIEKNSRVRHVCEQD
mmetsp:Transcript_126419/g.300184  ORF Transcript_126419/g.300184 Transcript_126419/m.300184 type:complete len:235 (-) Transcript_126419:35-739(-)